MSNENQQGVYRFTELDAMRGIAALVVVFGHYSRMWNWPKNEGFSLGQMLKYPLVAGHESVVLFFLLSGFVLSIPYLRGKSQPYFTFLARRVIRIYMPYLAALALAVYGAYLMHEHLGMGAWADQTWSQPVSPYLVLKHVLFVGDYDFSQFNTAFWSLVYEMRISLIFPALFWVFNRLRASYALLSIAGLSALAQGLNILFPGHAATNVTVGYIAIFALGITMAKNLASLNAWYQWRTIGARLAIAAASVVLYSGGHLLGSSQLRGVWRIEEAALALGSAGLILVALNSGLPGSFLNSRVPQFLGRISYSLYLVHSVVLFSLTILLRGRIPQAAMLPLYLSLSLVCGTVFYILIEEPLMRLSRSITKQGKGIAMTEAPNTVQKHTSVALTPHRQEEV